MRAAIVQCVASPAGLKSVSQSYAGQTPLIGPEMRLTPAVLAYFARLAASWGYRLHLEIVPDGVPAALVMRVEDFAGWDAAL